MPTEEQKNFDREKIKDQFSSLINSLDQFIQVDEKGLKKFKAKDIALTDYENVIRFLADSKEDVSLPNSGSDHARIVMSNIFRTASNYVYIFARDLKGDVSNGIYLDELQNFLNKPNAKLKVVLERKPMVKSPAIDLILTFKENKDGDIQIGYMNDFSSKIIFDDFKVKHFTIADDRMYRLEEDTRNYLAKVNFNDMKETKNLKDRFESITTENINKDIFEN